MSNRCLATILILLAIARPAAALNPARTLTQAQHRIWQMAQGLPQASVYAIHQTADGYLWLATENDLVRFDGVRFTLMMELDNGARVRGMAEAGNALWVATDAGVRRWSPDGIATFRTAEGLPSDAVAAVVADPAGTIWAATAAGLARLSGGRWIATGPAVDVRAVVNVSGQTWSATGSTVCPRGEAPIDVAGTVSSLCAGHDGAVWVGTDHGLVRWADGVTRRWTVADGLADDAVTSLAAGSNGTMWIGTRNGVSRWRDGRFESFRAADGLSQSTVYSVTEDREGTLWVGTKHGLNQMLDRRAVPFTQAEGLASNDAGPVLADQANGIWVGTRDAGLCRFDGARFTPPLTAADGLPTGRINALAVAGPTGLWVGTDRGVSLLQDGHVTSRFTAKNGLPSDGVRCLREDGGDVWVGTDRGATVFRNGQAHQVHPGPVEAVSRWRDRMVLATADAGVLAVGRDLVTTSVLTLAKADAFYADPEGLLWVGTRGDGVRLIDPAGHVTPFRPADGLFDDDVFGIAADDAGRLWMACSKGVFSVARADLLAVAARRAVRVRCTPFSPTDALRTVECQAGVQPSVCRARDGRLWFATIRGLLAFDPNDFTATAATTRPAVAAAVEEVVVDGRSTRPGAVGNLPSGVENLTFRYTAMTLVGSTYARFRYQLEGFDPSPIDAGNRREAYYTNLPPGHYRFRVSAVLGDGPMDPAAVVEVGLAPRLDQRPWFWPTCVALLAAGVWAGYRARVRQVRDRLRLRLSVASAERARIARELHDTLLQGFSGVTMQMQALSARLPAPADRSMLTDIIADAATCMAEARRSVAGLRDATADAVVLPTALATAARQLTESGDVRLHLNVAESDLGLSVDTEYHLLRIAQEAMGNAVRHAAAGRLDVTLSDAGGHLCLDVSDDGRGFDAGASPPPGHFGLIGMRERAVRIGADLRVDSAPGRGTTVSVTLPTK